MFTRKVFLLVLCFFVCVFSQSSYNINIGNKELRYALNTAILQVTANYTFTDALTLKWTGSSYHLDQSDCPAGDVDTYNLDTFPPRPANGSLARILDTAEAKVCYGLSFIPFNIFNATTGNVTGMTVDLVAELLRVIGLNYGVNIKQTPVYNSNTDGTQYLITGLLAGNCDISGYFLGARGIDRKQYANWPCNIYPDNVRVMTRTNYTYNMLSEGSYVFGGLSTSLYNIVRQLYFPNSRFIATPDTVTIIEYFKNGTIDAFISDLALLGYYFPESQRAANNQTVLTNQLPTYPGVPIGGLGLQLRKDSCEGWMDVLHAVNAALKDVIANNYSTILPADIYAFYSIGFACGVTTTPYTWPTRTAGSVLDDVLSGGNISTLWTTPIPGFLEVVADTVSGYGFDIIQAIAATIARHYNISEFRINVAINETLGSTSSLPLLGSRYNMAPTTTYDTAIGNQIAQPTCSPWALKHVLFSSDLSKFNTTGQINAAGARIVTFGPVNTALARVLYSNASFTQANSDTDAYQAVFNGTADASVGEYLSVCSFLASVSSPPSSLAIGPTLRTYPAVWYLPYDSCNAGLYVPPSSSTSSSPSSSASTSSSSSASSSPSSSSANSVALSSLLFFATILSYFL